MTSERSQTERYSASHCAGGKNLVPFDVIGGPAQGCSTASIGPACGAEEQHKQQRGNRNGKGQGRHPLTQESTGRRTRSERGANPHEHAGFSQQTALTISSNQNECPLDRLAKIAW